MTNDVHNALIQTAMPPPKDGETPAVMKIAGVLVDLLVDISLEVHGPFVGRKVLLCPGVESTLWNVDC